MYWLCHLCDTFKISCPHWYYAVTDTKLDSTSHMHTKHISTHVAHTHLCGNRSARPQTDAYAAVQYV